jgi:hypothetical protein
MKKFNLKRGGSGSNWLPACWLEQHTVYIYDQLHAAMLLDFHGNINLQPQAKRQKSPKDFIRTTEAQRNEAFFSVTLSKINTNILVETERSRRKVQGMRLGPRLGTGADLSHAIHR